MRRLLLVLSALSFTHCNVESPSPESDAPLTPPPAGRFQLELDPVALPPANVSLLLLGAGADRDRLVGVVEGRLGGVVYQLEGARLAVASVPANADAILTGLGVSARFARSVDPSEIPNVTTDEARFVRVFDSRYYAGATSPKSLVLPLRRHRDRAEPMEAAALTAPVRPLDGPVLDTGTTPFASGTIVVSILLPESNGVAEPSTEDWNEELIVQTYQKVQEALEAYTKSEPNAHLRFIVHYESSPGHGGLPGTIDSDYECGAHFEYAVNGSNQGELDVTAPLLARLLGHAVTSDQVFDASWEYLDKLRDSYHADGAYYIKVTPNTNFTAGFRAHAYINGPWTSLSTDNGFEVFTHESGHIFGAQDEYCPDQCVPTTAFQGYLGIANANAAYRLGGDGIDNGMGENAESLMNENDPDAMNGYSRAAWGWLDSDGDGIFDVRDTAPQTSVTATVAGHIVTLSGTIVDQPEGRVTGALGKSFNRITALEYRLVDGAGSDWFAVPLTAGSTAAVNVAIGGFPAGTHTIAVRGRNSVGNSDGAEKRVTFTIASTTGNSAPRLRLDVTPAIGSVRSTFTLAASAADFDANDGVDVRFDRNGDGTYDTAYGSARTTTWKPTAPGLYHVTAQGRDHHGAVVTAAADVYVLADDAPPAVAFAPMPSVLYGQGAPAPAFTVAGGIDPDGDAVQYNWILDGATSDNVVHTETGFAAGNTRFAPVLATPTSLAVTPVDLTAGQPALFGRNVTAFAAVSPTLVASAAGSAGLLFTDISTPTSPVVVANLQLETSADQLLVDGSKVYVLGGSSVTVVDVSKPKAPVELKQATTSRFTRTVSATTAVDIPDASPKGTVQSMYATFGERITAIEVDAEVDHPTPAQLTFSLQVYANGNLQTFTLRDGVAGTGGDKTYTFTDANTPALKPLVGALASGEYDVFVADNVAGGTGTFKQAKVVFKTATRAFSAMAGPDKLIGVLPNHGIVVAGTGLQVIDASRPTSLRSLSTLTGTGVYAGLVSGTTAMVLSPFTAGKGLVAGAVPKPLQTHALYAVDLSSPSRPVVKRQDESFGDTSGTLLLAGTRAYLTMYGGKGSGTAAGTSILDPVAFAAGSAKYVLGAFPGVFDGAIGTNTLVFGSGAGHVQGWDVSAPSAPKLVYDYARPQAVMLTALGTGGNALVWDGATTWLANLRVGHNILSRVYRVTLQARDASGATSTVTRTVHVVPYDHAPTVTGAVIAPATTIHAGDEVQIQATVSDSDSGTTWDPGQYVRADLDGDGIYETPWMAAGSKSPFSVSFAAPGTYTVGLQVRDLFYALGTTQVTVSVQ